MRKKVEEEQEGVGKVHDGNERGRKRGTYTETSLYERLQ